MTTCQWRNPGCVTQGGTIEVEPVKGFVSLRLPDALGGVKMTPEQTRLLIDTLKAAANRAEGKA